MHNSFNRAKVIPFLWIHDHARNLQILLDVDLLSLIVFLCPGIGSEGC